MSCDIAAAALYLAFAPASMDAASLRQPKTLIAAISGTVGLASEPLYAEIVRKASGLRRSVDLLSRTENVAPAAILKPGVEQLSALDMKAHLDLAARGMDGDLKCILKGISQDLTAKLAALSAAQEQTQRHAALTEMDYLLRDNVEVITAPPKPPV